MKKLIICGAGGHGKVCADCAEQMGYTDIEFLDDLKSGDRVLKFPVSGRFDDIREYDKTDAEVFVAIGNNKLRCEMLKRFSEDGFAIATLVHPSAVVSKYAKVGEGVLVMPGAIINAGTQIGFGAIINTGVRVDHDCKIGVCAHLSPGAVLSGTVEVGDFSWLCSGSVVANNTSVGRCSVVGAGSAVVKDVADNVLVAGVPAVFKKKLSD